MTFGVRGEAREIRELPSEPIHAVDDDPMDLAALDAPKKLMPRDEFFSAR